MFLRFVCTLLLLCLMTTVHATTYFVRSQGNDRGNGTTSPTAFRTLLRAVRMLNHGDTIVLGPGVYRENVLIAERFGTPDAPLTIIGDESGALTGDAAGAVVLESASPTDAALHVHRAQQLIIRGITFRGAGEGVRLEKVRHGLIERCTFDRLAKAISIVECEDTRVESSVISRGIMGMLIKNATGTRLAHLTVASCSAAGVMISSSANGAIRNSLLLDNATSMVADSASASSWSSDYNTINGTLGSWGPVTLCRIPYEWFAASGQERHSSYVAPAFVDPAAYNLRISPAITWGGGLPGMYVGIPLDPPVTLDRDGRAFSLRNGRVGVGAYNFPEPQPAPGWSKLAVTLPEGLRQSAAIYSQDGTLLRTLLSDAVAVQELWWDGRDDTGVPVAAGDYEVRAIAHDIRVLDDGALGDNGNPMGTYNSDNAQRAVVFADGSFVISTIYDEAGIPLRFHSSSGQPVSGSALADKNVWAIAAEGTGKNLIAGVGRELQRIIAPGERSRMPDGSEAYVILAAGEQLAQTADGKANQPFGGVAVTNGRALVTVPLAGGSVVRAIDLATGAKIADWPVPVAGDIDADAQGNAWVLCGSEVVCVNPQGQITKRYPATLAGAYLAVGSTQLAVISPTQNRIAILNQADGRVVTTLGQDAEMNSWQPVSGNRFRNLRDGAFLPDGALLLCEAGRVRAIDITTAQVVMNAESNFMDAAVPHPKNPAYVYCHGATIFHLDHQTGAWSLVREAPALVADNLRLGQCITSGTVQGREYLVVTGVDSYRPTEEERAEGGAATWPRRFVFLDITDPFTPRFAGAMRHMHGMVYNDLRFDKDGNLCNLNYEKLTITVNPLQRRDEQGMLHYSNIGVYGKPDVPITVRGAVEKDPLLRGMFHKGGLTFDLRNNDAFIMACTTLHNKMVPAWGASATGVGKISVDGMPRWFSLSSGGNYTSISSVFDGKEQWILAGKDFGGQLDLFSSDGLRLATGNWAWGSNWTSGFVDIREGVQAYMRPDGKPGAHVEDDNIGRFVRARVDGTETLRRTVSALKWTGPGAAEGVYPIPHEVAGTVLRNLANVPRVALLPVDGDWQKWAAAGVIPQIISLPIPGFGRTYPGNMLQTFEAGTSIGAVAHDGKNLYVYFLTTDNTPNFHAPGNGGIMWQFDSIELWLEEEQIGLGFNNQGEAKLFKYRFHDRQGKQYAANYPFPDANVWGVKLESVAALPLGQLLGNALGASLEGKPGYALMASIPMEEVKLVGGIAGRKGGDIVNMTGAPGEVFRIGLAFDGVTAWGREQDFKVYWPIGLMYSDPTTNIPFVLGE